MNLPWKHYGLEGKTVIMTRKVPDDAGGEPPEPWSGYPVKAKCICESDEFLTMEILPHRNPRGLGESSPYRTAIHKHDLLTGMITMRSGGTLVN